MTQEEKLEEAKRLYKTANADQRYVLESLFPELAESEDERIRKDVKRAISVALDYSYFDKETANNCLTWLEKQGESDETKAKMFLINKGYPIDANGVFPTYEEIYNIIRDGLEHQVEQKSIFDFKANNWCVSKVDGKIHNIYNVGVEPKFQNGQWIVWQDKCYKVNYNGCRYELIDQNGLSTSLEHGTIDESAHLWTIADAKDGDVLAYVTDEENLWIMIYWSLYEPYEGHVHYHALLVNDEFSDKGTCCIRINNLKPATKEQRALLFQKMHVAGYVWDEEKKEVKKIEWNNIVRDSIFDEDIDIPFGAIDSELYYQEINIPDGFQATIEGRKIILKKEE